MKPLLFAAFVLLNQAVALAGMDQPWNESNDGGPVTIVTIAIVIVYLLLLGRWPKQLALLLGAFLAGVIIHRWFGNPFGWLAGIALFIWGYKELIYESQITPSNPQPGVPAEPPAIRPPESR